MDVIDQKIEEINNKLDSFEEEHGLPSFKAMDAKKNNVKEYMTYSRDQLEALSPGQCSEIAVVLVNYALYIQRTYNRQMAIKNWAESSLNYQTAPRVKEYRGSFDQQKMQATRADDYSKKLLVIITEATQKLDRLEFISSTIKTLADKMRDLRQAKEGRT